MRLFSLSIASLVLVAATAHAQDGTAPPAAVPETTGTEEAQRAEAAAADQADAASASPTTETMAPDDEHVPGVLDDADHPERGVAHRTHVPAAQVFPEQTRARTTPEPDPELEEDELVIPPWLPEWRLRLGIGASAGTAGGAALSFRMIQELEWMPPAVAPLLFAITGGELIGDNVYGLGGVRVGLYGTFCEDRLVVCTGAVALRAGVVANPSFATVDLGGDGDARFRFDGVELGIRVGFVVIQTVTYVDLLGMVGAAF